MKPDGMLVEPDYLAQAGDAVSRAGANQSLASVAESEPAMASYIYTTLAEIAGKLALTGAPTPVIQAAHEDVLTVVLTCIGAIRQGHYELWKDCVSGESKCTFDARPKAKRGESRKKSRKDCAD